jgi:ribosomal protein S18 acetylase RimI-like enzyme
VEIIQSIDYELVSRMNQSIQELHAQIYPEHFKEYNSEAIKQFFKQVITNPNHLFFVIQAGEQELGYIWIEIKEYKENAFRKPYRSIYVHQLNILEGYGNRGLGTRLLNKVEEIAKTNQIKKIEVDYWLNNEIAANFYKKNGYIKYREFVDKDL